MLWLIAGLLAIIAVLLVVIVVVIQIEAGEIRKALRERS
jgi:hypothetical protein